uniref:Ig-like domain-containing protein n=1 Tax=Mastacembelus armatus TaxID=205130 RepID=A0A7N8XW91_9TELE
MFLSSGPDVIKMVVKEGDDAILSCSLSTRENIVQKLFDWKRDGQKEVFLYDAGVHYNNGRTGQDEQFRGRVSHFPDQLQNTTMTDSGNYSCDFPRLQTGRLIFHISLIVGEHFDKTLTDSLNLFFVRSVFCFQRNTFTVGFKYVGNVLVTTENHLWSFCQNHQSETIQTSSLFVCLCHDVSQKQCLQW